MNAGEGCPGRPSCENKNRVPRRVFLGHTETRRHRSLPAYSAHPRVSLTPARPVAVFRRLRCRLFSQLAPVLLATSAAMFGADAEPRVGPPVDSFVRISDDDGLAHSDVRSIAQDHEGFLWFGLRLAGLTRYDGYELKVHQHDPENPRTIGSRVIWAVLVDRGGTLWVGTEAGLDRYDRATDSFVHYRHDAARADSLSNNIVVSLFEDAAGKLWACTRDGLCRLDDRERGTFTTFRRPPVIEGTTTKDTYRSIIEDTSTGLLWLGGSDGLAAFDPRTGAFASYRHDPADPESVSRSTVNKVIRDEHGMFWALTEYGLNAFTPTFSTVARHSVQEPRIAFRRFVQPIEATTPGINFVRDGRIDRQGRFWLGTRGGVELFDRTTHTFTLYRHKPADPTSLSDDVTQTLFEDRSGNLWVGTYSGGVNLLRAGAKPFIIHRHDPGNPASLSEDQITGLAFDPAGRLWATTVNGLNRHDAAGWTRFLHDPADPASLPTNDFSSVSIGANGDVWIGTNYDGIYRFDQRRFYSYPTSPANQPAPNGWQPFTGAQIHAILPDPRGGVWIGARAHGLDYFYDGRFLHYSPQEAAGGLPAQPTSYAVFGFFARDGALWFATESSGLVRFEPGSQRFTAFQPPVDQPGTRHNLNCLAQGRDGFIWLGAADGLLKFDPATERFVRQYSTAQGLPHAAVMTIVRDRRDHLWLGTANGLADFDPATEKFRVYEKPDGLPSNVFAQRSGALGPDGRVYLGTRAGIVAFAPEDLRDNPTPPPVMLTEFRWLGTPPAQTDRHPDSVLNPGGTIRVPPGQLGFSLKFSALDFTAPEKNRFRYRLEGWEADWTAATSRERSATYTALPPGTYTFRVQASNADLVWNERGATVRLIVEPHFWQTPWFRLALALTSLAVIGGGIHWRLRAIRRRNALLERQVSQRTAQLQEEVAVRHLAEAALRESHQELEHRVQARTAELAQTNTSLQAEITGRKNIEAQLRQSQKMEAIGQLAGGIAHDFNNLLTVILGQSELLAEPGLSQKDRDAAGRDINAAAQRATNLTRQLLVFSRHQTMSPVPIDLNKIVAGVSHLLRHVIGEHIALETERYAASLGVLADAGMLEQVILNMAVNARDVMPRGGQLMIATTLVPVGAEQARRTPHATPGDYARFSVSDTGAGIPPEILPQIFEPFFSTKEAGKGTGLGLAISLGIVLQHRGWIDVETQLGRGTTFHVYLPSQPLPESTPASRREPPTHPTGHATILLAEDETGVRSLVQRVLTRQGYRVIEAISGGDALAIWAEHREEITVLLTDIVMPGRPDGHELAARLLKEKPSLRVVTMSGYDPGEVATRDGSVRPHLRKPFTTDDLLSAIESTRLA